MRGALREDDDLHIVLRKARKDRVERALIGTVAEVREEERHIVANRKAMGLLHGGLVAQLANAHLACLHRIEANVDMRIGGWIPDRRIDAIEHARERFAACAQDAFEACAACINDKARGE